MQQWLRDDYPKLRRLALRVGADILFGDEAGVRSDAHAGTTWAPKGQTPVVRTDGGRFGLNMISAVSGRGQLRFMVVQGRVGATEFVEFLRRLMQGAERPIFLVVDCHSIHRSQRVRRLLRRLKGRLRLFYLPPYSPELNPDELVLERSEEPSRRKDGAARTRRPEIRSGLPLALPAADTGTDPFVLSHTHHRLRGRMMSIQLCTP